MAAPSDQCPVCQPQKSSAAPKQQWRSFHGIQRLLVRPLYRNDAPWQRARSVDLQSALVPVQSRLQLSAPASGAVGLPRTPTAPPFPSFSSTLLNHHYRVGAPEGVLDVLPGARITDPFSIRDKSILVPPCGQPDRRAPRTSRAGSHRRALNVPIIERPRHCHLSCLRAIQDEFNRLFHRPLARARALRRYRSRHRAGLQMSWLHKGLLRFKP